MDDFPEKKNDDSRSSLKYVSFSNFIDSSINSLEEEKVPKNAGGNPNPLEKPLAAAFTVSKQILDKKPSYSEDGEDPDLVIIKAIKKLPEVKKISKTSIFFF